MTRACTRRSRCTACATTTIHTHRLTCLPPKSAIIAKPIANSQRQSPTPRCKHVPLSAPCVHSWQSRASNVALSCVRYSRFTHSAPCLQDARGPSLSNILLCRLDINGPNIVFIAQQKHMALRSAVAPAPMLSILTTCGRAAYAGHRTSYSWFCMHSVVSRGSFRTTEQPLLM